MDPHAERKRELVLCARLYKDLLQVDALEEIAGVPVCVLVLCAVVGKEDLFHGVFAKVEFPPVCALQFKEGERRGFAHENVGNLQHGIVARPHFFARGMVSLVVRVGCCRLVCRRLVLCVRHMHSTLMLLACAKSRLRLYTYVLLLA